VNLIVCTISIVALTVSVKSMVSADIIAEMCVGDFSVLAVVSGLFLHL